MFINTMQNSIAKHILSRIYAIRLAETMTKYDYAGTIAESANWASVTMNDHDGKEYDALWKFWTYASNKCKSAQYEGLLRYKDFTYSCKPPETVLHKVWNQMNRSVNT